MTDGIKICSVCPRNCNAERKADSGSGYCKMGYLPRIARSAAHMWEEPCISGTMGSGTIFFTGCVLSCVFCQNEMISHEGVGRVVSVDELCSLMKQLEAQGVHNINLVSPTPYLDSIIEALTQYRPSVPVVWNTGGYEKAESIRRLEGLVDIYLPDLKYISPEKSSRYSGAKNYFEYASEAIAEMVRQTGKPEFDEEGMMKKGTIVRHLILPSNTKNSVEVIRYLESNFGEKILLSLMGQYVPMARAGEYPEINRTITAREYNKVLSALEETALDGFAQDLCSANRSFIPDFDPSKLPL